MVLRWINTEVPVPVAAE